jgi:hypothetical protein
MTRGMSAQHPKYGVVAAHCSMKNVLISGSTGGIGEHLGLALKDYRIFTISRSESKDSLVYACDLAVEKPVLKDSLHSIDWIVHLATSYKIKDDLAMLRHLLDFAREHQVKNFVYASSWVVHFPPKPIKQEYVTMKRACERELDQARDWLDVYIIRPSVVVGGDLVWDRVLRKAASFYPLIPRSFTRSFVDVHDVSRTIKGIIEGQVQSTRITLLGHRRSLREMTKRYSSRWSTAKLWLVGTILLAALFLCCVLALHSRLAEAILVGLVAGWTLGAVGLTYVLPWTHEYFSGFKYYSFYPDLEEDVISLCRSQNQNIVIRGYDNKAKYYHEKLPDLYTNVVLKDFNKVRRLDFEKNQVRVDAGICFVDLLNYLRKHDRWLANYPNYHYITAGACILCPVHGSSIQYPFMADLVESFRYYDRKKDEVIELSRKDVEFDSVVFNSALINQIVVLTVDFNVAHRVRYRLQTAQIDVSQLDFVKMFESLEHDKHLEVRVNSLRSGHAYIQTYTSLDYSLGSAAPKGLQAIKADSIGRKWNLIRRNFVTKALAQAISRPYVNFEWFLDHKEFERFWEEIVAQRQIYRFYKLLIRFNMTAALTGNPYYNTISIDVMVINTPEMLRRCKKLYDYYRPLEHSGKFRIESLNITA